MSSILLSRLLKITRMPFLNRYEGDFLCIFILTTVVVCHAVYYPELDPEIYEKVFDKNPDSVSEALLYFFRIFTSFFTILTRYRYPL